MNHILMGGGGWCILFISIATTYTKLFFLVLPTSTFSFSQQILIEDLPYAMYFLGLWELVGSNIDKTLSSSAVKQLINEVVW